jgi:hypothetical protein
VKINLLAVLLLCVAGCTVLDGLAGIREDGTPMEGPSVVDTVAEGAKSLLGPYGVILGMAVTWAARERKHFLLVKAGKKDADRDGVEVPPTPAAT